MFQALRGIPRESYFLGSKVGRYEKDPAKMFDFSAERTLAGVDNTLQLLGVDYVDLIQVSLYSFILKIRVTFRLRRAWVVLGIVLYPALQ